MVLVGHISINDIVYDTNLSHKTESNNLKMSMTLMATYLCSFPPLQNLNSTSSFSILCSKTSIAAPVSSYNGLKHLSLWKIAHKSFITKEKKRRSKGKVVYASLFGVGAPEALVVGAVALLVFGPKGLAEVARNLGKTLRTFQPTIRELQDVSREFKSTLEKEIGLDDVSFTSQNTYHSNMTNTSSTQESTTKTDDFRPVVDINEDGASTSKVYGNITEEQPMFSASQQQRQTLPSDDKQPEPQPQPPGHSSSDVSIKSLVPPLLAVLLAVSPMVNTPVGQAIELQRGASLFSRACIGCHDTGGNIIQPGATLFLKDLIRNGVDTEEEIYRVTYNGKGRMPGFGESCAPRGQCTFGPRLKDEDIKLLAEFVKLQADQGWPTVETYGD